jgi:hypothetical protein
MEVRLVKILSPIGKPSVTLRTDRTSFDAIANDVKRVLGVQSFENLKAIISVNNGDDGVKRDLRGLNLPAGDIKIYLTQDKTKNGLSKAQQIANCEERLAKAIRAKKGGVRELREQLAVLKGESKGEPKKVAPKKETKPTDICEVVSINDCIPVEEVQTLIDHNLSTRRRY